MDPAIGQRLTLTILDIAFGGEGVARADKFVVFVPFTIVGEVVEVEIVEWKKKFARARLLRVLTASPDRVEPRCRYFGACGGCQYQHLTYEAQLRAKHKQVSDLFQRIGGFDDSRIAPVIACPQPYAYRNRVMIRSQWNKPEQRLNIGFIRWDGGLVEDIERCEIAEPLINDRIREVRAHPPHKGGLKVVLRIAPEDWEVPPDSFFQNNFFALPDLVRIIHETVREGGARHLIDLYCGVGFIGIELAGLVESFVGVEYDLKAIQSAQVNLRKRGVTNGEFMSGAVEEALPGILERFDRERTAVVLDPPRKGVQRPILELLRLQRPRQIVYVSCHPATMARDLNVLCRDGVYNLARVKPVDMFPQTQHVECVADLRLAACDGAEFSQSRSD